MKKSFRSCETSCGTLCALSGIEDKFAAMIADSALIHFAAAIVAEGLPGRNLSSAGTTF
jgi:hypothetical protein